MLYERPPTEEPVRSAPAEHGDVFRRLASFERSAVVGISLLLVATVALQTLISAHDRVVGQTSGVANAAVSLAPDVEAPDLRGTMPPARIAGSDGVHRFSTIASRIGPEALSSAAKREAVAPAREVDSAGEAAAADGQPSLRTDTFGPDAGRKPNLRLASIGSLPVGISGASGEERASPSGRSVLVIRPGERATGERGASDSGKPRVLGGDAAARVEKVHFQEHTPERCLPHDLLDVIYDVAERFGEVTILSTFRSPDRNRLVGGAEHSFHLSCQAIDFRVTSGKQSSLLAYLEARPEVGGLKRYPMGYFHIDNGPRRSW